MPRIIRALVLILVPVLAISATAEAQPVKWQACTQASHGSSLADATCAQLPLADTPSGHINLLKLSAFSDKPGPAIVVITGGPGTSAVALAPHYRHWFHKAQKEHDLLFIDQRGTGKSLPFDCDIEATDILEQDPAVQLAMRHQRINECITPYHQRLGLAGISTIQAARDIDFVRQQLGYEQLQLWGSSYGTRVALAYQQLFPQQVAAMVLDGVAPLAIALPTHAQADAESALNQLFANCDNSPACPDAFKPLAEHWQQALEYLAHQRAEGSPVRITTTDLSTQKTYSLALEPAIVANWVRFALYNRELSALLPLAIYRAGQGDFSALSNIAKVAGSGASSQVSAPMHAVILCREDAHVATDSQPQSERLPFSKFTVLTPVCEHINQLVAPAELLPNKQSTASEAPTLLLSGELDPITPPRWAELALQSLKRPAHWVIPGGHHGVTPLGCVTSLVNQFLIQGAHLDEVTVERCIETLKPLPPFIDEAGPQLPATKTQGPP